MYKQAKSLIRKNRLQEALVVLEKQLNADPRLYEILFQSGRHESLLSQTRKGLIHYTEATLTENQIRNALLELLKELESDPMILTRKRWQKLILGIGGVLVVSMTIFGIIRLIPEYNAPVKMNLEEISVETEGDLSPAVINTGPVNISYGVETKISTEEKLEFEKPEKASMELKNLKLKTEGEQSPAIITQDKAIVNYQDTDWEIDTTSVDSL